MLLMIAFFANDREPQTKIFGFLALLKSGLKSLTFSPNLWPNWHAAETKCVLNRVSELGLAHIRSTKEAMWAFRNAPEFRTSQIHNIFEGATWIFKPLRSVLHGVNTTDFFFKFIFTSEVWKWANHNRLSPPHPISSASWQGTNYQNFPERVMKWWLKLILRMITTNFPIVIVSVLWIH